jgi:hypothetical protein
MRTLEVTNIAMAFGVIGVLLALCTPLADPRRLSVDDQVARLEKGKVRTEAFDYQFLRFDAGRFGREALDRLKGSQVAEVAKRAKVAATATGRDYSPPDRPVPAPKIVFHPAGARPPEGFLSSTTTRRRYGGCMEGGGTCDARLLDVTGDGRPEVLMTSGWEIEVYGVGEEGGWRKLGGFQPPCSGFDSRSAVRDGKLSVAEPAVQDLVSPNGRMRFAKEDDEACASMVKP